MYLPPLSKLESELTRFVFFPMQYRIFPDNVSMGEPEFDEISSVFTLYSAAVGKRVRYLSDEKSSVADAFITPPS